jgi:lipoprotein NlpD
MQHTRKWISIVALLAVAGCGSRYQAPIAQSGDTMYLNSGRQHNVNAGETLYAIAWMYDLDPNLLAQANNMSTDTAVVPGQKLLVDLRGFSGRAVATPARTAETVATASGTATTRAATGLGGLQREALPSSGEPATSGLSRTQLPPSDSGSTAAPPARQAAGTATGSAARTAAIVGGSVSGGTAPAAKPAAPFAGTADLSWAWPYKGNVIGKFADTKGIELAGKEGDPVLAAADGEVVYAGSGLLRYGNILIIKHNDKYLSAYAHNKVLLVSEKAHVTKGQKIAEVGVSGGVDKPQLHFEIRVDGKPVDPLTFLPPQK